MRKVICLWALAASALFTSCIQDEPLNAECDIVASQVHLSAPESVFYNVSDTTKRVLSVDTVINYSIRPEVKLSSLSQVRMTFAITPGARITPANGSVQDFSKPEGVRYEVVSEDGKWKRVYWVRFSPMPAFDTHFSFETAALEAQKQKYYEWFELGPDGNVLSPSPWATGNSGFAISKSSATPDEYPSVVLAKGVKGQGVKLETRDTRPFGNMVNMRIAAGNLFLGQFDTQNALKDAMKATCFGIPFNRKPLRFKGYYKFTPGPKFEDKYGIEIPGKIDAPDAYVVLYRNTDKEGKPVMLHGDDVLTHPNIVGMARVKNFEHTGVKEEDSWAYFDIPFEYTQEVDREVLRNFGYNLAVVYTSSIEGASFRGAIGSTFLIDESEVVYEE